MEEMNRVLIDNLSQINFAPTLTCVRNLQNERMDQSIAFSGHPIVDVLNDIDIPNKWCEKNDYAFMTIHRRENISDEKIARHIFSELSIIAKRIHVVFSCHPHTQKQLSKFGIETDMFWTIGPAPYKFSLEMIKNARFVITDSGGIIQEAAILGTPCFSLMYSTGWVETVNEGVNHLVGTKDVSTKILALMDKVKRHDGKNIFGPPGATKKIVSYLTNGS
jgi:UDP-N-acetylglucosamine 2-epimerase